VDANMLVLQDDRADFHSFNVGSGRRVSVLEYASAIRSAVGRDVKLCISNEYRRGDNRHSVSAIQKLRGLGWEPKRDLATILTDFLHWVNEIGGIPEFISDAYSAMKNAGVVLAAAR